MKNNDSKIKKEYHILLRCEENELSKKIDFVFDNYKYSLGEEFWDNIALLEDNFIINKDNIVDRKSLKIKSVWGGLGNKYIIEFNRADNFMDSFDKMGYVNPTTNFLAETFENDEEAYKRIRDWVENIALCYRKLDEMGVKIKTSFINDIAYNVSM